MSPETKSILLPTTVRKLGGLPTILNGSSNKRRMSASVNTAAASAVSGLTAETGTSGQTGGRGRGGRRNRAGQASINNNRGSTVPRRPNTFKGNTAEMNANVFDCFEEHGDRRQYAKTLEALEGHMTMKYSENQASLFALEKTQDQIPVGWKRQF